MSIVIVNNRCVSAKEKKLGIIRKRIVVLLAVLTLMTASFASCGTIAGVEEDGETLSVVFQGEVDDASSDTEFYAILIENTSDESIMSAQIDIAGLDKDGNTLRLKNKYNLIMPRNEGFGISISHLRPGEYAYVTVDPMYYWEEEPASYNIEFEQIKKGDDESPSFSVVDSIFDPYGGFDVTVKNEGDAEYTLYGEYSNEYDSLKAKGERAPVFIAVERDSDGNVTTMDIGSCDIEEGGVVFGPGEEKTITVFFPEDNPNYEIIVTY